MGIDSKWSNGISILKRVFLATCIVMLSACEENTKECLNQPDTKSEETSIDERRILLKSQSFIETNFSIWLEFYGSKSSSFLLDSFEYHSGEKKQAFTATGRHDEGKARLYEGLVHYSLDSLFLLDVFSYNVLLEKNHKKRLAYFDVDSRIEYYDLRNREMSIVYSGGASSTFEESGWLSESEFIVVGSQSRDSKQDVLIWYFDIGTDSLVIYKQELEQRVDDSYLRDVLLDRLGIEIVE